MLKKLFVHEWKDCWRLVGLMNLIVLGLTVIGVVVMQSDTWSFASENAVIRLTMILYVMAYIASVAALSLVTVFFFYNRFYKNLYTDQGYLMHTLPVTQHDLVKNICCADLAGDQRIGHGDFYLQFLLQYA